MMQGLASFWDFAVAIQSKNSLLRDTTSHLPNDKLRQQIGAGMELRLSKKVSAEKLNQVADFRKWMNEVHRCDEALYAEREEYERIAKESCDASHRTPYNANTFYIPNTSSAASLLHPVNNATNCSILNASY